MNTLGRDELDTIARFLPLDDLGQLAQACSAGRESAGQQLHVCEREKNGKSGVL